MKKFLFYVVLVAAPFLGNAQIFIEDWDGNGPGIGAWTLIDGDKRKVTDDLSPYFPNAWSILTPSDFSDLYLKSNVAASTSRYRPKGQSNDWLISPIIKISGANPTLAWQAKSGNQLFPEEYKVMLAPNGGNTINDFTVELAHVTGERAVILERHADLSAYDGKDVRIAFVNISNNELILCIDNILVTNNYIAPEPPKCPTNLSPADGTKDMDYAYPPVFTWDPASADDVSYKFTLNGDVLGYINQPTAYLNGYITGNGNYTWEVNAAGLGGESSGCSKSTFTTSDGPTAPYCGPIIYNVMSEPITLVRFAGIDNATDPDTTTPTHEIFLDKKAQVQIGKDYTLTVKGNTNGVFVDYFVAFIDWNQNNIFEESETYVLPAINTSTGLDNKSSSISIKVPDNAKEGTTRMRVKKTDDQTMNLKDPCKGAYFGQVEEYSVNVTKDLAVSDVQKSELSVYPNPVKDLLNIDTKVALKSISIYDLSGKLISNPKLNSDNQINLSSLTPGIYVLKVLTTDGKTLNEKIVKK